ncbi:MAG: type II toxin-antitoxin system RelE/ParE family toxin [Devosia sp.]
MAMPANSSPWSVRFHVDFVPEWKRLPVKVKIEAGAVLDAIKVFGPSLGRPQVDTVEAGKTARHRNLKELRVTVDRQVWRFMFAFDPAQSAVVLCGAAKQGKNQERFYETLIDLAATRYDEHLKDLK